MQQMRPFRSALLAACAALFLLQAPAVAGDKPAPGVNAGFENIVTGRRTYAHIGGKPVTGYLAMPRRTEAPTPGILLIHAWWGLNGNIRATARLLARNGYIALAVDLYGGKTATRPERARELMRHAMNRVHRIKRNLQQAYYYLDLLPATGQIGVVGWGFGGGWSLRTALLFPKQLAASVIYSGALITDPERLAALEVPILGLFGGENPTVAPERIHAFDRVLTRLRVPHEIHVYPDAGRGFTNPSLDSYAPDAAGHAWAETMAFLRRHLESGPSGSR